MVHSHLLVIWTIIKHNMHIQDQLIQDPPKAFAIVGYTTNTFQVNVGTSTHIFRPATEAYYTASTGILTVTCANHGMRVGRAC